MTSVGTLPVLPPPTERGVERLLASKWVEGTGATYARKLAVAFGASALERVEENPAEAAAQAGVPLSNVLKASASLQALGDRKAFLAFLFSAGISELFIDRIIGKYRSKAMERATQRPYSMVEDVWQLSFFTADRLGSALGIPAADPERLKAALVTAVRQYSDSGSLFAPVDEAVAKAAEIAGVESGEVASAVEGAVADGRLVLSMDGLYIPVFFNAEEGVARKMAQLAGQGQIEKKASAQPAIQDVPTQTASGVPYTELQRQAIAQAMVAPVMVLTGGPGTGKTTVLRGVIEMLEKRGDKFAMVAPTGKAAKRMTETTGRDASTIHRLLGWGPKEHRPRKKLDLDVIIIDEGSMMEQVLFNHLMESLRPDTRILMVGDVDQLPAIGAGDVMRDLIGSRRIPVAELNENFRQKEGSLIAAGAKAIREGEVPCADETRDFIILNEKGTRRIHDRILSLVCEELPARRGLSPWDILVVTPQQIGPLGARQLNADLQQRLNPDARELVRGQTRFRVGDPVMQTANSPSRRVYNGETGRVKDVDLEGQALTVEYPGLGEVRYERKELGELTLAYATTVHKLQGSEVRHIVMPVTMAHKPMLYRNLLYTGVSRARELCVLVGEEEALRHAVGNDSHGRRLSNFGRRLQANLPALPGV